MLDQAELVREVVRGSRSWRELSEAGITVHLADDSVSVIAPTASPVPVTAGDVATGWLRHSGDLKSLRHWARFVHGYSNLIELQFDEHALGEKLLEALWQVAFHEPVTQEMHDLARRVLFQA